MTDFLFDITNYISLITVVQLLSFSLYLILTKRKDQLLLGFFLIANSLYILDFWLIRYGNAIFNNVPELYLLLLPFGLLFGPLLYANSVFALGKKDKFIWKSLYHAIPFFLLYCFFIISFQIKSYEEKILLIKEGTLLSESVSHLLLWSLFISCITYITLALRKILNYKIDAKENLSSIEKLNIDWLMLIVFGFLAMWGTDFISYLLSLAGIRTYEIREVFLFISLSINLVFANLILIMGLRHPELLHENWITKQPKPKYESSSLPEENKIQISNELKNLMKDKKPFLEPDLTLNDLAEMLKIHPRTLSQIINEKIEMSFYDYVNGFRINEACAKLTNPEFDSETIMGILLESGFNSKSVFNSLFKKTTGVTPSEYRKRFRKIPA